MNNQQGLLPFYLKLYTFLRVIFIFFEYKKYINITEINPSMFFLSLIVLLSLFRLFILRKVNKIGYYALIGLSFLLEGLFFLYYKNIVYFGKVRVFFELCISVFTILSMIYLYPYYLLRKEKNK